MSKLPNLPRPVMSGRTGLDADQARCERGEERNDLTSPKALATGHLALAINCMDVKYVLRDVQSNCRDFHWCIAPVSGSSIASISPAPRSGAVFPINGRLRDESLNETLFTSLAQARVALGCWRADYNNTRPHSQLGWKTPSEFAFTCHPRRELALRYAESSAPAPVAPTAQPGKSNSQGELRTG